MDRSYYLFLGPDKMSYFSLPPKWVAAHFLESGRTPPSQSVREMTREALARPFGIPSLRKVVSVGRRVAVIVDDGTRPTPASEILAVLLPQLIEAGCPKEATVIVVALGTHPAMTGEELALKLGAEVASTYRVVQHNAWQDDLVPVKTPGDGPLLKVNAAVTQADVRIGISSILPHPMAGYGGGPKLLMPGVEHRFHHASSHEECDPSYVEDRHFQGQPLPRGVHEHG